MQEAWDLAKHWYRDAKQQTPKPSRQDFLELLEERDALYAAVPSPGIDIPIHLDAPFTIPDNPPTPDEVAEACDLLRRKRAPGATGIRAEDLQRWLQAYRNHGDGGDGDPLLWEQVLIIVDTAFRTGELPKQLTLSILVVIPKPSGGVRGIGLLEAVWKLIEKIIDLRLTKSIKFHEALHGFRKKRGCGTAILQCRLEQERTILQGWMLFQVFLDLTKAYDTFDRVRTL